jgi:hypothetical protein
MSKRFSPDMKQPNNTMARVRTEVASQREQYGTVKGIVRDKNGNIVDKRDQSVDSLVTNFWKIIYNWQANQLNLASVVDLNGTTDTVLLRGFRCDGALEGYQGIVCGSSNTAVAYLNTQMGAITLHGFDTSQISAHETSTFYDPATNTFEMVRTFTNADTGAADITIREVGIAGSSDTTFLGGLTNAQLVCRDVLSSPLVVPYEGQLTVIYTIQFSNGNYNYSRLFGSMFSKTRSDRLVFTNVANITGVLANRTIGSTDTFGLVATTVGDTANGIVLGTSNVTATNLNTWALSTPIGHGTSGGQLFYYESTISSLEEDGATNSCRWYLNRVVQNRSGGSITVNEIGLYSRFLTNTFMVDRKFPDEGGVTITNGQFATFSWEFCYIL